MLYQVTKLRGYTLGASDGEIGSVEDVYFDDERWGVRYFVVNTGRWLSGRLVLISPLAIRGKWRDHVVPVALTREQVENSPPVESRQPVSRRYEMMHAAYYRNPYYWNGAHLWGIGAYPMVLGDTAPAPPATEDRDLRALADAEREAVERSHLRSSIEVIGYRIEATDGSVGHLDDLLVDTETWAVAQLIVDKREWLPGGQVLVAPEAVARVDWSTGSVSLKMTREEVRHCPDYS